MTDELDTFDFDLALALGKTIDELSDMPTREYAAWRAFFTYRAAMADLARKQAGG